MLSKVFSILVIRYHRSEQAQTVILCWLHWLAWRCPLIR